eukprot:365994-Chlamydomonas_euryale.AAC.3
MRRTSRDVGRPAAGMANAFNAAALEDVQVGSVFPARKLNHVRASALLSWAAAFVWNVHGLAR